MRDAFKMLAQESAQHPFDAACEQGHNPQADYGTVSLSGLHVAMPPEMFGLFCYPVPGIPSMIKLNLIKFYWAGKELLRPKTDMTVDEPASLSFIKLNGLLTWLRAFFLETMGMSLPSTRSAARELIDFATSLSKKQSEAIEAGRDMPLTLGSHVHLTSLIEKFEREFEIECRDLQIFSVSNVGTHSTNRLLDKAHANLPRDTIIRLSKEAISDVDEAGRCLAFDRPTAAGFHILRAVEPLILAYCNKLTKKSMSLKSRNWGAYSKMLTAHGADAKIVGMLDHIRVFYRNPIMHPEEALNHDQAISLFHTCLSAIVQLDAAIEALP